MSTLLGADDVVLIVGGGQAAVQTAMSLREGRFPGSIAIVADEPGDPYQRPPLSKTFLHVPDASALPLRTLSALERKDITVRHDRVTSIDRAATSVSLEGGDTLRYDHLVLATGARNRELSIRGSDLNGVAGLRTLQDAIGLREALADRRNVVVVGGGFIGTEFAASAATAGHRVTVVEAGDRIMARAVSPELSAWITQRHRHAGNRVELSAGVSRLEGTTAVESVLLSSGERLPADLVLVAVGVVPNVELAAGAGLAVDNGVVVDAELRTNDPRISVLGDCVNFPCHHAGAPTRLESVQNATDQARHLARGLLSAQGEPYRAVPWFWTHQFDATVQMAGVGAPSDESVIVGDPGCGSFSIYRFRDDVLTAVESVNAPAEHMAARRLLVADRKVRREDVTDITLAVVG